MSEILEKVTNYINGNLKDSHKTLFEIELQINPEVKKVYLIEKGIRNA